MDLIVGGDGRALWGAREMRAALGRAGVTKDKREGDGATPEGKFPMRCLLYRPDRIAPAPRTGLPMRALREHDGWCDASDDPSYNRPVTLPYGASAEKLWLGDDHVYDLIVPLGYNDERPEPGRGSAIFLHVARESYSGTAGCVALALADLLAVLAEADPQSHVIVAR